LLKEEQSLLRGGVALFWVAFTLWALRYLFFASLVVAIRLGAFGKDGFFNRTQC